MTINKIIDWILYAAVFSVPLFFLPNILEPIESGKQTWFFFLIFAVLIVMAIGVLKKDKLIFRKNLISWILVLFLGLMATSAALSDSNILSWVGFSKQEYTSFSSLLFFSLFFWVVGSRGRGKDFFSKAIISVLASGILVSLIGVTSIVGWYLPFAFSQTQSFNTIGTINSLGIYLAVLTILANSFFLLWQNKKPTISIMIVVLSILSFVYLALINYWVIWSVLLVGLFLLLIMLFVRAHELHHTKKYLLAMFMTVGAVILLFAPLKVISIPTEISPNTTTSWTIAKSVMTGKSFWFGSGPGTYVFDFAKFRPSEVNQTNFWNTRFDRGSSEFLTMLPTKGFLPTATLTIFAIGLLIIVVKKFLIKEESQWHAFILIPAWISLLFASLVYTFNFALVFLFFFLAGLIYSLTNGREVKINLEKTPRTKLAANLIPALIIIVAVTGIFMASRRTLAEAIFTQAIKLDRFGNATQEIASLIDRAASMNRYNDSYYRNLAAILLIEVEDEIATIENNQPTEEQSKYLQALVAASINAAKHAAELEPNNVSNWLELGTVYRSFVPIMEQTGEFAVAAFKTALELEPNNPSNFVELGKTYLALASISENEQKTANFNLADQTFQKAIELKNDYAPAHYQLAVSFEQQGRLDDAIGKMEEIIKYNPQDIGAGFELGVLYIQRAGKNDFEAAKNILNQVVEILPSYSNAHWYLGYIYEQEGNYESAIAEIEKILELNPDNEIVKTRLENLKAGPPPEPTKESSTPEPVEDIAS